MDKDKFRFDNNAQLIKYKTGRVGLYLCQDCRKCAVTREVTMRYGRIKTVCTVCYINEVNRGD